MYFKLLIVFSFLFYLFYQVMGLTSYVQNDENKTNISTGMEILKWLIVHESLSSQEESTKTQMRIVSLCHTQNYCTLTLSQKNILLTC